MNAKMSRGGVCVPSGCDSKATILPTPSRHESASARMTTDPSGRAMPNGSARNPSAGGCNQRIFLSEVRQGIHEPAIKRLNVVCWSRMWIADRREIIIGVIEVMLGSSVQPAWRWLRVRPRMMRPDMIRHHVEQNLHAELMSGSYQVLRVMHIAEAVFYFILIHRSIAVIVRTALIVLIQGRKP